MLNSIGSSTDIVGNWLQKLTVQGFSGSQANYGQTVGLGVAIDFRLDDVAINYGAQGLSSFTVGVNYPIELTSCLFQGQTDAAIFAYGQMMWASNLRLKYFQRSAVKALQSNLNMRNVFCAQGNNMVSVVRLYQSNAQLDNWDVDIESDAASDSYFFSSLGYSGGGPIQLSIRDTQGGNAGPGTAAVRLVSDDSGITLANTSRGTAGWCTIERSFNQNFSSSAQAIVAVDGPLWQGFYQGLPPAGIPLAVNTTTPSGTARFGLGTVPAAAYPPPVALAGVDPILTLPGLLGYYRADALPERDGSPIAELVDLGPAHNNGTPVGNPVIWESGVANGHAALQFGGFGSGFRFSTMTGTSGAATMFFVAKLPPGVSTNPGQTAALLNYGPSWRIAAPADADKASVTTTVSDVDWAVYAVRCTTGSTRVLQCWANGHPGERVRRDDLGPVTWSSPYLGANSYGWTTSQCSVAVVCDAALSDEQVATINQFLLNQFRIPV